MTDENPYQTPQSQPSQSSHAGQRPTATMGWRLVNLLVDTLGVYAFAFLTGVILFSAGAGQALEQINEYLFGALLWIAYYTPQEALFGRTLGKLVTGTRVVNAEGGDIGWFQALKRSLFRLVPFEAFSFLSESRPRGWHDRWSGTRVVSLREQAQVTEAPQTDSPASS